MFEGGVLDPFHLGVVDGALEQGRVDGAGAVPEPGCRLVPGSLESAEGLLGVGGGEGEEEVEGLGHGAEGPIHLPDGPHETAAAQRLVVEGPVGGLGTGELEGGPAEDRVHLTGEGALQQWELLPGVGIPVDGLHFDADVAGRELPGALGSDQHRHTRR